MSSSLVQYRIIYYWNIAEGVTHFACIGYMDSRPRESFSGKWSFKVNLEGEVKVCKSASVRQDISGWQMIRMCNIVA